MTFKSSASVYAVCEFCRSTLLRDGESLKNLGRMADLMDDPSLIQIGTEGKYKGIQFGVIGRIQLKHASGLWNEWHILFDDGRSAWLSEAGGEYVVSARVEVKDALPPFESLEPEMLVAIGGKDFIVSDLEVARCIAGQGELPFKVESGYDVNTADLRSSDRLVTIDYSEAPPLLFVGYPAKFNELGLVTLRESTPAAGGKASLRAEAFNCPHCAAPLTLHSLAIECIGCPSCGTLIGFENDKVQLLRKASQDLRVTPWLPLGSKGRLANIDWEVIGFMQRSSHGDGALYTWSEYLLFNAKDGFAWLTEYQGHWNFACTMSRPPSVARGQYSFWHGKGLYKLFSSSKAEVTYVVGEFYWRVKVGDTCLVEDYILPPQMLSREVSANEATWSDSAYLEPEDLCAAFKTDMTPPARIGIFANQPNPLVETHKKVFRLYWVMLLVATLLQLAFFFMLSSSTVLRQQFVMSEFNAEGALASREFVLGRHTQALRLKHTTDIENNWVGITSTLVEKNTGEAYQGAQEIGFYHGVDEGERWSEGARDDAIVFKDIPAGTYYLNLEFELGPDGRMVRNYAIVDTVELTRNPVGWSNYALVLVLLTAFPLISRWRRNAFEARRWEESDLVGEDAGSAEDDE